MNKQLRKHPQSAIEHQRKKYLYDVVICLAISCKFTMQIWSFVAFWICQDTSQMKNAGLLQI